MTRRRRIEVPSYPDIEEAVGYNPARFLKTRSRDGLEKHGGDTTELHLAICVIRGIDDLGTINAWIQVERDLFDGGRDHVMKLLEHRREIILDRLRDEQAQEREKASERGRSSSSRRESPEQAERESGRTVAADGGALDEPVCPDCTSAVEAETVDEQRGWWCPECTSFVRPLEVSDGA
ncbi:hypothetical protein [Halomarina pelagica]|uniref:hypothetical protein n=1 Tax=Halomarina pelagica TaxID=2961599 RepID=UPI0020C54A99|nr:hypothetical protein [Halomarina sp. BND7]